ncbi:MAG: hypothetical protein HYW49_13075, partial [Deltaproteobacteria bacterium]|nr:hypothetical protein [Deltaproteobacteria bacterium]
AEGSSSAAVGASAATEGGIVDKGEAKDGTRADVAGGMKAPKFDMMDTKTDGAKGGAGASNVGGSGTQAAKGEKESALTAGAKPEEQIAYEAAGKGAGKQGSPFTGSKFGSDFDSAGKGVSAVGFSRDSAGAAAGSGTGEEDPETYLARAGTGSLFERVHPHFSRWGDQVQSGKWQSEFKRLGK